MAGRSSSSKPKAKRTSNNSRNSKNNKYVEEPFFSPDVVVILAIIVGVLVFVCNLGLVGSFGDSLSKIVFGLFGLMGYVIPFGIIAVTFFSYVAAQNSSVKIRLISSIVLYALISILIDVINGADKSVYDASAIWRCGADTRKGGGIVWGSLCYLMNKYFSKGGTIIVTLILVLVCILIIMGRDAINGMKENGRVAYGNARERSNERREAMAANRAAARERAASARESGDSNELYDEELPRYARKRRGIGVGIGSQSTEEYNGEELTEIDKTPRRDKRVSGVMSDTSLKGKKNNSVNRDDMHEITISDIPEEHEYEKAYAVSDKIATMQDSIRINGMTAVAETVAATTVASEISESSFVVPEGMEDVTFNAGGADKQTDAYDELASSYTDLGISSKRVKATVDKSTQGMDPISKEVTKSMNKASNRVHKKYKMPTLDLLNKASGGNSGSSREELMKTAANLAETLETFGVKAKVVDISQGPSVTRFELQPEVGVRVNKIVSLADDLKLSLAATDIRIEAPIPGKSAVGIEVPNKSATAVGLRELLEDKEFKNFDSKIAFAVGKDIAGKVVVTDIAKMPHMLIAGSTGSGKSVCINTIIMSILYKAHPDDVKLIMVDPKVVELSVYNGIPHLMVPVVTDPKKAAAALHWGVAEMTTRYQKFADMNVRDLKGYNKACENLPAGMNPEEHHKLPQIVIIVDELADLMMVAAKEVEESICRLAQLARACGIHLIIATQRPSVDVITGLIKANMPSRVAFAVSSGVDSRTILDMNGAEKLLGKGDMLFYPQGYPKPARVQGAFVSDAEVSNVVKFLKDQDYGTEGQDELLIKMNSMSSSGSSGGAMDDDGDDRDDLFAMAGRFIIEQDKASIGSLQRKFKIGFNRAARIMDQLCEAGVVSGEEGTKARTVLMGPEQFEQYIEEYV